MPLGDEPIAGGPIAGEPIAGGGTTTPTTTGECPAIAGSGAETDLLNDALGMIGQSPITAIDDGSVSANYCLRFYPTLRDAIIRSHHWNFAMRRAQLAATPMRPLFEFAFAYPLPPDLLKIVEYNGAPMSTVGLTLDCDGLMLRAYRIEGRQLLTNESTVFITYLRRVADPTQWDGLFYQVVATWLASKLALAIPKDEKMSMALFNNAQGMLSLAMAVDGQEGSVEPVRVLDLLWGR